MRRINFLPRVHNLIIYARVYKHNIYGELFRQDLSSHPHSSIANLFTTNKRYSTQSYHINACTVARGRRRRLVSREDLKRIRCRLSTLRRKFYSEFIVKTRNPWRWRRLLVWWKVEGWGGADVGLSSLSVHTSTSGTLRFG